MKALLGQFLPGPKALAVIIPSLVLWLDHRYKWGISDLKIKWGCGLALSYLATHEDALMKIVRAVFAKGAVAALVLLALAVEGCAITPGEIQAGTSLGLASGLTLASIAVPAEKDRIATDARTVATAVNQLIPTFFPGATSAALLNSSVDTALSVLKGKLASSPHGPMIVELIAAARVPFAAVLGSTSSPTAAMSPTTRADVLAFFTGVSTAISQYLGDPSLMPPRPPPAPTAAVVPK